MGTKTLLPNVSGSMINAPSPCTDRGSRTTIARAVNTQHRANANTVTSPSAPSTPTPPPARPEPEQEPERQHDRAGREVTDEVGSDRAEQRCRAGDRQAAEAVEDAGLQVVREPDAGARRGEHDGLHEHPGQRVLQVGGGVAGDRTTEDVDEQQQEDHRLQGDVQQRLGGVDGLRDAPPGERGRLPQHVGQPRAAHAPRAAERRGGQRWWSCGLLGGIGGGSAGQGQEHVVQRRQSQPELGDGQAGGIEAIGHPDAAARDRGRRR